MLVRVGDSLSSIAALRLGEDVVDVSLYRCGAQEQGAGDFGVGQAGGDQREDLCFPGGQAVGQGRCPGRRGG